LSEPSDLSRWLVESGVLGQHASVDEARLEDAKKLRQAIYEIATSVREGLPANHKNVKIVNEFAAYPVAQVQLDPRSWRQVLVSADPIGSALSAVARDAINLFTGPQAKLIRACDEPGCRMLYVDSSPGGRRRWCSMTRCGSRAKVETYRKRHEVQDMA
jgi:predicted RNA-binding Zn ribbon-like protein